MEQVYTPTKDYKVLVRCFTYNQSKYIEDALNGFAMQKTDFPFVCLVMDDASTDGEQEVIKAWMERECDMTNAENLEIEKSFITLVPHKTNSSCTYAFYFLKENLYRKGGKMLMVKPWREHCKYEALCEGDDCWIVENKLQSQAFILDNYESIGLIYTNVEIHNQRTGKIIKIKNKPYKGLNELFVRNYISTLTTMYRIELYKKYLKDINPAANDWKIIGDWPIWLWFEINSKVYYIDSVTSRYRSLEESASHSRDVTKQLEFANNHLNIAKYYINRTNVATRVVENVYDNYYRMVYTVYKSHSYLKEAVLYLSKIKRKTIKDMIKLMLFKIQMKFMGLSL